MEGPFAAEEVEIPPKQVIKNTKPLASGLLLLHSPDLLTAFFSQEPKIRQNIPDTHRAKH